LLQGRISGVQVTPASGEPGAGISINIRGTGSIRSNNNPLFVIDGVPLDNSGTAGGVGTGADDISDKSSARNPLAFLNPADIENISILKDASAAAIYGSRGANGVVLITTRKGSAGQGLQFSANTSISNTAKRYDLLSGPAFLRGVHNAGGDSSVVNGGANIDWQDQIFQTAVSQNYNLGYGNAKKSTRYRIAFGYENQEGIVKNSSLERLTARLNGSQGLFKDKIKIDLALTGANVKNAYAPITDNSGFQGSLIGAAIIANPTYPIKDEQGNFYTPGPSDPYRNPAAMLAQIDDSDNINRYLGNISATWNIIEGLAFKSTYSLDHSKGVRKTWYDPNLRGYADNTRIRGKNIDAITGNGRGIEQHLLLNNYLTEQTLTYDKKLNKDRDALTALVGFSYQKIRNENYNDIGYGQTSTAEFVKSLSAFSTRLGRYGDSTVSELQSFFTRVNYNLNDKYLFTATLRADGSSKFGENNKYGYFPAFAVRWKIMNESFVPKNIFNDLSLRLNYGITGNQEFPGGASLPIFQHQFTGDVPLNAANPNLKWETTTQYGAGLDYTILKGRVSGTIDYFNKDTKDLLFLQDYAQPAAIARRWVNLPGNVINRGVEFGFNIQAIDKKEFNWQILYNMTFIKNTIKNFGNRNVITGDINGQGLSGAYAQIITNGYPLSTFSVAEFAGFDDEGFGIYPNGDALTLQGSALPKFNAGLTSNFTLGRFSASFFLNASTGFYIYNNTANALFLKGSLKTAHNVATEVANSNENPINPGSVSTRFLEKGNFLRLANASLGYTFNTANIKRVKNLRVSLSGQNLFLITDYSGLDPEVNTNKARNSVPSRGIDYTSYPNARTFTLSLNAGF
jgi:TonB-dependent starch-binding outer membrane protein SusC